MREVIAISLAVLSMVWGGTVYGQEESRVPTGETSPHEIYGGLYLLGSFPRSRALVLEGQPLNQTEILNGAGAGFRAGIFPSFTRGVLGIQADTFGFGHEISAPPAIGSAGNRSAKGTLIAGNTLVSIVVRYPGSYVQPYAGVGAGLSSAHLAKTELVQGASRQTGTAGDMSLAHQYFAGARANLSSGLFLFGEYRWFSARYTWTGALAPSLEFRSQMIVAGLGMSFD